MLEAADVGRAMERLRGDRTQRSVARRAGIHRSSWSSYEAGRRMPSSATWPKIAHGLECSVDRFDQEVLRSWDRRLRPGARAPAGEATAPLPLPGGAPGDEPAHGALPMPAADALHLLSSAERIRHIVARLLHRIEEPRPVAPGGGEAEAD